MIRAVLTNGMTVVFDRDLEFVMGAIHNSAVVPAYTDPVNPNDQQELFIFAPHIVYFREVA